MAGNRNHNFNRRRQVMTIRPDRSREQLLEEAQRLGYKYEHEYHG